MIDGGEESHRQPDYRDTFKGFSEAESQASNELRQTLGIIQSARTYHYEGNPRFAKFRLAAARLFGSSTWEPHVDFLASSAYRGTHSKEHRAIFTKPTDIYAELHELGHAFAARVNSDFDNVPEGKWNKAKGVEDRVSRFGLGEGLSEWIAIASGFRTQDPTLSEIEEAVQGFSGFLSFTA